MHTYFSHGCKYFYVDYFQGVVKSASEAVPPTQLGHTVTGRWEEGIHKCGVCDKDCGYRLNLYFHMLKQHPAPKPQQQQTPVIAVTPGTIVKRGRGRPRKDGSVSSRASLESAGAPGLGLGLGTPAAAAVAPDTSATPATVTKWRNGVPPPYWVWGRYICEVGGTEKIKYGCVNSKTFLLSH